MATLPPLYLNSIQIRFYGRYTVGAGNLLFYSGREHICLFFCCTKANFLKICFDFCEDNEVVN